MKISIFAYTKKGCETAANIAEALKVGKDRCVSSFNEDKDHCASLFTVERLLETQGLKEKFSLIEKRDSFYGDVFCESDVLIFVGATGIAVRNIAPYIQDKMTDPAVISVDELGKHIIPILSGHIGGANALSERIAEAIGGEAIITTATDINQKFSVDTWAISQGLLIENREAAKDVSAAILEGDVLLKSDLPVKGSLPENVKNIGCLKSCGALPENAKNVDCLKPCKTVNEVESEEFSYSAPKIGIYIGWKKEEPFDRTLRLIPKVLHLGIGSRKGVSENVVHDFVNKILEKENIDIKAVKGIASIDLKEEEEGLLSFAKSIDVPISFYSSEELAAVKGDFSSSQFVESIAGVDNVCERAAVKSAECGEEKCKANEDASGTREPELIVKKVSENGVTLAIAAEYMEVCFE